MTKAELYQKACMLPLLPGVYIIRDKSDTIIYIGKAKRLRIRVSQYFREGVPHDNKVSQMIAHAYAFDVIVCQSEFEALVLEASQIKAHTPKYNILLKDDKGYSYIRVTREDWPRLSFTLQKEEDGAEYIGPYTSSFAARQMAETAMDAFLLPRCSKRFPQEIGKGRPCLNAHIGKCMAVCSGKISCETYNQAVKNAVHLIRYGKKDILKTLNERMQEASDRLEFETAALLRDQINAITKLTAGQKVVVDPDVEMDVVALAGTPDSVCAAVLRFREGRLTDKREFLFHDTADIAAVREEFLPRYYLDDEQIPKVIAVDELPPEEIVADVTPWRRAMERVLFGLALFCVGVLFAYKLMMPFMLRFLSTGIEGAEYIQTTTSIESYVNLCLTMFIIFGCVFEMPLITIILSKMGIINPQILKQVRGVAIVVIFFIAAVVTPPDIVSQCMVAFPMVLLYFVSIFLSGIFYKPRDTDEDDEEEEESED